MKKTITLSAVVALSMIASCKQEQPTPPANNMILVDISESRDSSVVKWYKETIHNPILEKSGPKDRTIVLPVDFNSETSGQEIFKADFSKDNYSNEYAGLQRDEIERKNHLDSVSAAIRRFDLSFDAARQRRVTLRKGTDIFGALLEARKYIVPGYRNTVVIFSDMLQVTDRAKWNFEDRLNHDNEIDWYLSIAPKIDLKNMAIIVLTGNQNNIRPEKFNTVKAFWERYFTQCNGSLIDYSSGAVTKLEEALKR